MPHDVFISYPRVVRDQVEPIRVGLERLGVQCFFDVDSIDGGAEFPTVIDAAVKAATVVLGCWTPAAFKRTWVMQECRVGRSRGVLLPVALEEIQELEVPTEFFGINILNLTAWRGEPEHEEWGRLLRALEKRLKRKLLARAKTEREEAIDLIIRKKRPDGSRLSLDEEIVLREEHKYGSTDLIEMLRAKRDGRLPDIELSDEEIFAFLDQPRMRHETDSEG